MESNVKDEAMAMCRKMQDKVRTLGAEKASVRHQAIAEAKAFCKKAKQLVAKEVGLDYAALKASRKGRKKAMKKHKPEYLHGLPHKEGKLAAKQGKLIEKPAPPRTLTRKEETRVGRGNWPGTAPPVKKEPKRKSIFNSNMKKKKAHHDAKKVHAKKVKKVKKVVKKTKTIKTSKILNEPAKEQKQAKKRRILKKLKKKIQHNAVHMEGNVRTRAVHMCKAMMRKVRNVKVEMREMALHQATTFCNKAKALVKKEVGLDSAALKAGKSKAGKLKLKAKGMKEKQRKLMEEEAAVKEASKIHNKRLKKVKDAKAKIMKREERKITEINEKRLDRLAIADKKKAKKLGWEHKKLTKKMKQHDKEQMKVNKHCKTILKNLKAMRHQIVDIEETLMATTEFVELSSEEEY